MSDISTHIPLQSGTFRELFSVKAVLVGEQPESGQNVPQGTQREPNEKIVHPSPADRGPPS